MRSKALAYMLTFGLAGAFDNRYKAFYGNGESYEPTKRKDQLGNNFESKKQGQKTFTYKDGFQCQALNKKSADKKHSKWLTSTELKEGKQWKTH